MTPKALSAEGLERTLERLTSIMAGDRAIARFEVAAHIAALEADNAALAELVQTAAGERGPDGACWACGWRGHHQKACRFGVAARAPHSGAALLERHEKALVRARNEGLEKAKRLVGDFAATAAGRDHVAADALADEIDALKEPEQ